MDDRSGNLPGPRASDAGTPEVDRLWAVLAPILRLDALDPQSAWRQHMAGLRHRAELLQEHHFAGVRFRGGGTDLSVGLMAGARWMTCETQTRWGHPFVFNLPTEEVFTTPDYRRTEGVGPDHATPWTSRRSRGRADAPFRTRTDCQS